LSKKTYYLKQRQLEQIKSLQLSANIKIEGGRGQNENREIMEERDLGKRVVGTEESSSESEW